MQENIKIKHKILEKYSDVGNVELISSLEGMIVELCIQASKGNTKALKGVKQYGKYSPESVKNYFPLEYPAIKEQANALKYKNKTALEIGIIEEIERTPTHRVFGYTKTEDGVKELQQQGITAIFKDVAGGIYSYNKLLDTLKPEDTLIIHSVVADLNNQEQVAYLIKEATRKEVILKCIMEPWFTNSNNAGICVLDGMVKMAELTTSLQAKKQAELLAYTSTSTDNAKVGARLKAGADMNRAIELYKQGGKTVVSICEECKVSRSGLWRRLKALGLK